MRFVQHIEFLLRHGIDKAPFHHGRDRGVPPRYAFNPRSIEQAVELRFVQGAGFAEKDDAFVSEFLEFHESNYSFSRLARGRTLWRLRFCVVRLLPNDTVLRDFNDIINIINPIVSKERYIRLFYNKKECG